MAEATFYALNKQETPEEKTRALQQAFQQYLGRSAEPEAVSAFLGSPVSIDQRIREIVGSPEFLQRQEMLARQEVAPETENLLLQEQQARTAQELGQKRADLTRMTLEEDIADSIRRINKSKLQQQESFMNAQQKLGIRPSGLTQTGLADLTTETGITLNNLERQRANQLAQLALQSQESQSQFGSALRQVGIARGAIEQGVVSRKQQLIDQARTAVESAIKNNDEQAFNRAIQLYQVAQKTPRGTTLDFGPFGQVQGLQPEDRSLSSVDLGDKIIFVDPKGNIVQTFAKGLSAKDAADAANTSILGGNPELGLSGDGSSTPLATNAPTIDPARQAQIDAILNDAPVPQPQSPISTGINVAGSLAKTALSLTPAGRQVSKLNQQYQGLKGKATDFATDALFKAIFGRK